MKKRIPFSIEHRENIESGDYKVFTKYGLPVQIVKWDCQEQAPILGYVDKGRGQTAHFYCEDGTCYDGTEEDYLYILVETYSRAEALKIAMDEATKDPESAKRFLRNAGIIDENGELAEPYRSHDYENSCNESLRTKIKNCIFAMLHNNFGNDLTTRVYNEVEYVASQILKIFGIKDTDKRFT